MVNNIVWLNLNKYYVPGATFPQNLLTDIRNMGMGAFRYPGA